MSALVLISAILIEMSDESTRTDVASRVGSDAEPTQADGPFDILSHSNFEAVTAIETGRPAARRRSVKGRLQLAHRVRPDVRPLQFAEPRFVPTTLVIYPENGEIKTRIEPWIQS
jgi:hypothetical protein